MNTDFEKLIPKQILFSIKEIADLGIIKTNMCKKLIYDAKLERVKIGNKNYVSRTELIRYLNDRTAFVLNNTKTISKIA